MLKLDDLKKEIRQLERRIKALKEKGDYLEKCWISESKPKGSARGAPSPQFHLRSRTIEFSPGRKSKYIRQSDVSDYREQIERGRKISKLNNQVARKLRQQLRLVEWASDRGISVKNPKGDPSGANNEWWTPSEYIESARKVMGVIDLDPASNDEAQKCVKAETYYTIDNSGLDKPWAGRVWMNPPYSPAKLMTAFIEKLVTHYEAGDISEAIVLTNGKSDTKWFNRIAVAQSARCEKVGRINFNGPKNKKKNNNSGQIFFYLGSKTDKFCKEFSQYGRCF